MNNKRKTSIILILIGIGIPLVLYFFQDEGWIQLFSVEKHLGDNVYRTIRFGFMHRYSIGVGIIIVLVGTGLFIFSFFPNTGQNK